MNLTSCEKKDTKTAELTVTLSPEEFDKALEEAYKKSKGQISVPGFRKGKAPRKIIEKMYGASVFYNDALDSVLPGLCGYGIEESKLKTVGYPKIKDVTFGDDKSATVQFEIELYPEVEIDNYKGLSAYKMTASVEESSVDSELASVQLRNARIQTTERPAINGDTTIIDYEGFVDGKPFDGGKGQDYELVLGSNSFIPGFEAKMQGMTTGEERDLELEFPTEYHAKDLAGKAVVFKVKLKELKEKLLPELDDDFAKDVSEFDTLEDYKNSIREKLLADKKDEAEKAFEDLLLSKVADNLTVDLPEAMIEEFLDNQLENFRRQLAQYGMELPMYLNMMGTNEQGFKLNMRPNAEKQVKITLALEKIAELEKIEPSAEDVDKYYVDLAEKYKVDADIARQSVAESSVKHELSMRAAAKLVVDTAIATDEPEAAAEEVPAEKEKKARKSKTDADASDDAAADAGATKKTAKKSTAKKESSAPENKDE